MDCFQDFCLFCDRDAPDGPYCSQRCKLADLEKASTSNPGSPTSTSSRQDHQYVLSPAYKFHHDQQRTPGYDAPAVTSSRRPRSSYFMWTASPSPQQSTSVEDRSLSPSSSRTSLSSTSSGSSAAASGAFSAQAKQQLQEYFSSFDQARAAKRRSSTRST